MNFKDDFLRDANYAGKLRVYSSDITKLQFFVDLFLTISPALYIAYLNLGNDLFFEISNIIPFLFLLLLVLIILPKFSLYSSLRNKKIIDVFSKVTTAWASIISIFIIFLSIPEYEVIFNKNQQFFYSIFVLFIYIFNHIVIRLIFRLYRMRGGNSRNIIFYGDDKVFNKLINEVKSKSWMGLKVVAWFSDSKNEAKLGNQRHLYKGDLVEMKKWLKKNKIDSIYFSDSNLPKNLSLSKVIEFFGNIFIPVYFVPDWDHLSVIYDKENLGNLNVFKLWGDEYTIFTRLTKNIFDFIFSFFALLILSPILVLVSLLIYLSGTKKIIFKQTRYGLNGKKFYIYKFRTMYVNEDSRKIIKQAIKNDSRVTPLGKILRKWSIDELPQLINVIKGEMSIVGPRPHAVFHNEYYRNKVKGYMRRHSFKPGITGLAQINDLRGETSDDKKMEERINYDLDYLKNWSLFLDIKIIIKTF